MSSLPLPRGVNERAGLDNPQEYHRARREQEGGVKSVPWTTKGLKVTRFRLLSDPGFPWWDVSYCHGVLDGNHVTVVLPFSQLPKRNMFGELIAHARKDGINAKRLGMFSALSTLC